MTSTADKALLHNISNQSYSIPLSSEGKTVIWGFHSDEDRSHCFLKMETAQPPKHWFTTTILHNATTQKAM